MSLSGGGVRRRLGLAPSGAAAPELSASLDPRVVPHVARKVAEAAIKTGVAQLNIDDFDAYEKEVALRVAASRAE